MAAANKTTAELVADWLRLMAFVVVTLGVTIDAVHNGVTVAFGWFLLAAASILPGSGQLGAALTLLEERLRLRNGPPRP